MSASRGDGPVTGPFAGLSGPFTRVRNRSRFADMLAAVVEPAEAHPEIDVRGRDAEDDASLALSRSLCVETTRLPLGAGREVPRG